MYNPFFKLKRAWFVLTLPRRERKNYCLKHFIRYPDFREQCLTCASDDRVRRQFIEREMAYYNMALRDPELADVLRAEGRLEAPVVVDHHGHLQPAIQQWELNEFAEQLGRQAANGINAGDFMPDGERVQPEGIREGDRDF